MAQREPFNDFLVVVAWKTPMDRRVSHQLQGYVSVDMGCFPPAAPITDEEMQSVAFAAKMAMAKVLRARDIKMKRPKKEKS